MNYPLISEYVEAIKSAEDNFEELNYLRPVLGDDGLPVMTSGNFAVVFKMKDEQSGKLYAVKCFTKEQEGRAKSYKQIAEELNGISSPYLIPIKYLENELFVDTTNSNENEFPILLMDWVEGKPLDKYLRQNLKKKKTLEKFLSNFYQLVKWLIAQPFAHGDLKPDNILVKNDGNLVLVDYDGMYVPAMKGQKARELGSPDFRHPQRTDRDLDEHIDDFSIISILLSLKVLSINPKMYEQFAAKDRLLFSERDYFDIGNCRLLKEIFPSNDEDINKLVSLFVVVLSENQIPQLLYSFLDLKLSEWQTVNLFSTDTPQNDINGSWEDEFGFTYSKDNTKLLYSPSVVYMPYEIREYTIHNGTKVICDRAFDRGVAEAMNYSVIRIPNTVTHIGNFSFGSQEYIESITIPDSVVYIGKNPFVGCKNLKSLICLSNRFVVYDNVLYSSDMKRLIYYGFKGDTFVVPNKVESIGDSAFEFCESLVQIILPSSVKSIESSSFWGCKSLKDIIINCSTPNIGYCAFDSCESIEHIYIPAGTRPVFEQMLPGLEDKLIEIYSLNNNSDSSYA